MSPWSASFFTAMMGRYILSSVVLLFVAVSATGGTCPPTFCMTPCPYGFKTSAGGCSTCTCIERAGVQFPACPDVRCFVGCPSGYSKDGNSCLTCNCAPEGTVAATSNNAGISAASGSCPEVRCLVPCAGDYQTDVDGCPTCECAMAISTESEMKLLAAALKNQKGKL